MKRLFALGAAVLLTCAGLGHAADAGGLASPNDKIRQQAAETTLDRLLKQAEKEAPAELQFYLIKTYERMSGFTCKVRATEQISGWQQIRVSGEAAFSWWDSHKKDFVWRSGKFEVEFDIVKAEKLKLSSVSFDGIARKADL